MTSTKSYMMGLSPSSGRNFAAFLVTKRDMVFAHIASAADNRVTLSSDYCPSHHNKEGFLACTKMLHGWVPDLV